LDEVEMMMSGNNTFSQKNVGLILES